MTKDQLHELVMLCLKRDSSLDNKPFKDYVTAYDSAVYTFADMVRERNQSNLEATTSLTPPQKRSKASNLYLD